MNGKRSEMMHKSKNTFKITLTVIALASLAACGGKKVTTVDDSADYKSETSLQPLKRPDTKRVVFSAEPVVAKEMKAEITEFADAVEAEKVNDVDAISELADDQAIPVVEDVDGVAVNIEESSISTDVSSQIITNTKGATRMEINAEFDSAWNYLNNNLKTSDLTVFSRNKSAGRFSIGCGGIEADSAVVKKGGWSFLNREKHEQLEYCALDLVGKRGKSHVTVLNRSGKEVLTAFSKPIFQRILSN
jgi:uncharacterized lipoprotein